MRDLKFEWDEAKDSANRRKHGVAFVEACSVFSNERALLLDDPDHSPDEARFIQLGLNFTMRSGRVAACPGSSRRASQPGRSAINTFVGDDHEKAVRFLESTLEPLCQTPEAAGDDSPG
jgi:uncharacterized DUF497 family protein